MTKDINNPYTSPRGEALPGSSEFAEEVKFYSPNGRMGRLRMQAYLTLMGLIFYAVVGGIVGVGFALSNLSDGAKIALYAVGGIVTVVGCVAFLVFTIFVHIKRLHDLNKSGWFWLLMFVPLLNLVLLLYMLFAPGTPHENDYGLHPPPNKTWHWVVGLIIGPILAVLGIVASIAIRAMMSLSQI